MQKILQEKDKKTAELWMGVQTVQLIMVSFISALTNCAQLVSQTVLAYQI